ncbi:MULTISPECIES: DUF3616 domain-containing protein [unclassified Mesorhizobium]|uniref:DUF3616 domain-containing protein n=1 Tax=unclassified Mesorhizobium TaxID=325217 RepID=UPI000FCA72E5|nr:MULTISPECIES: DUF3616 domain-containing protein [unclassified Mesorhizobium]RUX33321.1 DUF3616 domain-containing protein [Mesorhizobium sp. M2A.F.Ca.ET.042.01.1.1]RWD69835.1 MAG: DUF3616 domain-containing protein [Mesorhizobium sp.]
MAKKAARRVRLDYAAAASKDLLHNLSGLAADGRLLWTVSDEGRTFECLAAHKAGYVLARQYRIDDFIARWPGARESKGGAELDLEAVDVAQGALWLCGSHCHVRMTSDDDDKDLLRSKIHARPSRHLLARITFTDDASRLGEVRVAPTTGAGSIRGALARDAYLKPFLDLPSKENGLDIEGLIVTEDEVLLGLRGPRLDSSAVVVHLRLDKDLKVMSYRLSFLDLGGLAIRDLGRNGSAILIIAGPVGDAIGPFHLYRWKPEATPLIQHPEKLYDWPIGNEKPEGLCFVERNGKPGHLIVYDRPDKSRIKGSVYAADWIAFG